MLTDTRGCVNTSLHARTHARARARIEVFNTLHAHEEGVGKAECQIDVAVGGSYMTDMSMVCVYLLVVVYALRAVLGRQPAQQRDLAAVRARLHPHRQLRVQEVPAVEVALVAVHRAHLHTGGEGRARLWSNRLLELPLRLA